MHIVHSYLPIYSNNEPDPTPLLDWLRFTNPGIQIVYPRVNPLDYSMQHLLQEEDTYFVENKYGIPEPVNGQEIEAEELELIIVRRPNRIISLLSARIMCIYLE